MKNYTITVNGNVYNVTVEEGTTAGVVQAPAAAPKAAPAAPKAAAPAGAQGSVVVTAPMPGKILAVKANAGARFGTAQCNPLLAEWEYVLAGLVCG